MSRAESSWERLVNAALQRDRAGGASAGGGGPGQGSLMEYVPSSLANNRDIDAILRAADELQDEDPSIARICKLFFLLFLAVLAFVSPLVVILLTFFLVQCVSMLTRWRRILTLIVKAEECYSLKPG